MSVCLGPPRALLYGLAETAHHPAALLDSSPLSDQYIGSLDTSRQRLVLVMHRGSCCLGEALLLPRRSLVLGQLRVAFKLMHIGLEEQTSRIEA